MGPRLIPLSTRLGTRSVAFKNLNGKQKRTRVAVIYFAPSLLRAPGSVAGEEEAANSSARTGNGEFGKSFRERNRNRDKVGEEKEEEEEKVYVAGRNVSRCHSMN